MSTKPSTSKSATVDSSNKIEADKINELCIAEGCPNMAVPHSEWDNEYCSVNCCYNHCKATFKAWLIANKESAAYMNPASDDQEVSTSISNQNQQV